MKYKDVYPVSFSIWNGSLHVDDLICSLENTDLAYTIHGQINFILGKAGFNMRKRKINVHPLQDRFKEEINNESTSYKYVGDIWNLGDEVLSVNSYKLLKNKDVKKLNLRRDV